MNLEKTNLSNVLDYIMGKTLMHRTTAAAGNQSYNALMALQLAFIAAFTHKIPKSEILEHFDAWQKEAADFCKDKAHPISKVPYTTLEKLIRANTAPASSKYLDALHAMREDIVTHKIAQGKDLTVSDAQRKLTGVIMHLLNSGDVERDVPLISAQVSILGIPVLQKWYKVVVADQKAVAENLQFLVKKVTGRKDDRLTMEESTDLKEKNPKRHKDYTDLRKKANDIFKAFVRNYVRESGKSMVDVEELRKATKAQGINIHTLDRLNGFVGKVDENGALYTTAGVPINGAPGFGYKVVMNPNYDAKKDDSNYFIAKPDPDYAYVNTPVQDAHFYTKSYVKGNRIEKKFEKVDNLDKTVVAARKKWLVDMNGQDLRKQALGAMLELLYSHAMRVGGKGNSTDGNTTYGLTTFLVKQAATLKNGSLRIAYEGKSGMDQKHVIKPTDAASKKVIAIVDKLLQGKKPGDYVFLVHGKHISATDVNKYIQSVGLKTTAHKFRHLKAAVMFAQALIDKPLKKNANQKEAEDYIKDIALKIGEALGHQSAATGGFTAATAIKSYINPKMGISFFANRGLRTPKLLQFAED